MCSVPESGLDRQKHVNLTVSHLIGPFYFTATAHLHFQLLISGNRGSFYTDFTDLGPILMPNVLIFRMNLTSQQLTTILTNNFAHNLF